MNKSMVRNLVCVVVCVLVVAAVLVALLVPRRLVPPVPCVTQVSSIPKVIWTYWDSAVLPPSIQTCLASWKKHMPGYDVRVLSDSNLNRYMDGVKWNELKWIDSHARKSDVVRICVLSRHGGIWSDASIMLYGPHPMQAASESGR